jgi:hypothetical protein
VYCIISLSGEHKMRLVFIASLFSLASCQSSNSQCPVGDVCTANPDGGADASMQVPDGGGPADLASPAGGPIFLSYGTDVTTLNQNDTVNFVAVLTDPMGVDNLAGGTLTSTDGTIQYGAFGQGAQKGAYSLALSWMEINKASPIDFTRPSGSITLLAVFFNAQGIKSTRSTTLTLTCNGLDACDGACKTLLGSDNANCGACGSKCATNNCSGGMCPAGIPTYTSATEVDCQTVCTMNGKSCVQCTPNTFFGTAYYAADNGEHLTHCTDVPPTTLFTQAFIDVVCCCQ